MRAGILIALLLLSAGCATQTPRQYLDETTAATVTVVASPWVFAGDDPAVAFDRRGLLSLYALDVNKAGSHRRYLAVMQSAFDPGLPDEKSARPTLEVQTADRKLEFQSTPQTLLQLGSSHAIDKPITFDTRWWYFSVSNQELVALAQMSAPRAALVTSDARFSYVEFRNGSKELMALSAALE